MIEWQQSVKEAPMDLQRMNAEETAKHCTARKYARPAGARLEEEMTVTLKECQHVYKTTDQIVECYNIPSFGEVHQIKPAEQRKSKIEMFSNDKQAAISATSEVTEDKSYLKVQQRYQPPSNIQRPFKSKFYLYSQGCYK